MGKAHGCDSIENPLRKRRVKRIPSSGTLLLFDPFRSHCKQGRTEEKKPVLGGRQNKVIFSQSSIKSTWRGVFGGLRETFLEIFILSARVKLLSEMCGAGCGGDIYVWQLTVMPG